MSTGTGRAGRRTWGGLLQVCGAGVLWGTGGVVVTILHERDGVGAPVVSAWRMLLAAVVLVGVVVVTRRGRVTAAVLREHRVLTAAVGTGTAVYQGLYFASVLMVGVAVATVVSLGLAPVLAAVWEHLRVRSRPSWREVGVLGTALVGLVLVCTAAGPGADAGSGRTVAGLLLAVAAGATYAATTTAGHALAGRVGTLALTTGTTAVGALVLVPFLAAAAVSGAPVLPVDPTSLGLLLYLGVATMALAYGLLYAGLRTTRGSVATVATLVEPMSAVLLAAVVLDQRLPWSGAAGCLLVLAAVAGLGSGGSGARGAGPGTPAQEDPDRQAVQPVPRRAAAG